MVASGGGALWQKFNFNGYFETKTIYRKNVNAFVEYSNEILERNMNSTEYVIIG